MNLEQIRRLPKPYWEALTVYECWRRMGFKADEIFVLYEENFQRLHMKLIAQQKEFIVTVGSLKTTREDFTVKWTALAEAVNSGEIEEHVLQSVWERTFGSTEGTVSGLEMLLAMSVKGFKVPTLEIVN